MKNLLIILNIIFIPALWANELNTVFNESGNLTDQQVTQSKEFVHQGIKDKVVSDGCKGIDDCKMKEDNGLETIIGQVYSTALPALLSQMKDKGGSKKKKSGDSKADPNSDTQKPDTPPDQEVKAEEKDSTDWCMIGAMGYEMFSMLFQEKLQGKAAKSNEQIPDPQLRSLVNLRETHKARKKTANYQATAYGAVTTCYAIMLATPYMSFDWKIGVKMGGAALLTTLYAKKASKHDKLAKKVQKVISALPMSGQCNPWTQSSCFCEEPTSKDHYPAEYQEVCVLNGGDFDTPKMAMGCAAQDKNGKVTYDEQCSCKQTKTCVSHTISAFTPNLSGATNLMKQMEAGVTLLDSGLYDEARLRNYSTQTAAMGSQLARQVTNPNPQPIALTDEQKKVARELAGLVTPELAAQIASAEPQFPENSIAGPSGSLAGLSPEEKIEEGLKANAVKGKYKASGVTASGPAKKDKGFVMPNLLGKKAAAPTSNIEIMNFAERAVNNADVNNTPETPIFDIISNRYRHAWKRLE